MFIKEFLMNTKQIGAILPSSIFLAKAMTSKIDYNSSDVIVELGAGNGVFTKEILKRKSKQTKLIILEINPKFYNLLKRKYAHLENVYILKERAENLEEILKKFSLKTVDYVISGLPFLNFSKNNRNKIFYSISKYLKEKLILFQYTSLLESEILNIYKLKNKQRILLNIPPAYVYTLENIKIFYTDIQDEHLYI